jgi:TolB protein
VVIAAALAPGASPAWPGLNGKIVYAAATTAFAPHDIWVMSPNGSNKLQLTTTSFDEMSPQWSPDGKRILFQALPNDRQFPNDADVYVMNADGSQVRELTFSNAFDGDPTWSPDGKKIAFESQRDGNSEIYVMNANGSGTKRLTINDVFDGDPGWSPDGKKIAFSSDRDGNREIYSMNADGSGQTRLTNDAGKVADISLDFLDADPAWSPDAKKIAFESTRDGDYEIYTMNEDGSDQKNLSQNAALDALPAWSPDGKDIVFESERGEKGNRDIFVMTASDGTIVDRLTNEPTAEEAPDWQALPPIKGCTITGTAGDDTIVGTRGNDVICALGGDDIVSGGGGNDRIYGGAGDDALSGGPGADTIYGGPGVDVLNGGSGRDVLRGQSGGDRLLARDRQRDVVDGGPGIDHARWDHRLDALHSIEHGL